MKTVDKSKLEAFEKKYENLLAELADMPKDSDMRENRYKWFCQLEEHDNIVMEIMQGIKPDTYNKLVKSCKNDVVLEDGEYNTGMDDIAFLEGLREAVLEFDGVNSKGEKVYFLQLVSWKLERASGRGRASACMRKGGVTWGDKVPEKSLIKIGRLVAKMQKDLNGFETVKEKERKLQERILKSGINCSEKEKEIACERVMLFELMSGDIPIGEDEESTYMDYLQAPEQSFYEGEDSEIVIFLEELANNLETNWKMIQSCMGKVNRDILRALITKDILQALKLMCAPEKTKSELLEPKCGQWCARRERCSFKKREGCYVRYDMLFSNPPYGSSELYGMLQPIAIPLYDKILHKKYLDVALENGNFEDVYMNKLYPNPIGKDIDDVKGRYFDFSDKTLAQALGKDKGQVSNSKKVYETAGRNVLYQMFVETKK